MNLEASKGKTEIGWAQTNTLGPAFRNTNGCLLASPGEDRRETQNDRGTPRFQEFGPSQ
jgi:hypothetical protein